MKIITLSLIPMSIFAGAHFSCMKDVSEKTIPMATILVVNRHTNMAQEVKVPAKYAKEIIEEHARKRRSAAERAVIKHRKTKIEVDI